MSDTDIPLYAIAELLIRISAFHQGLGEYQGHVIKQKSIIVTTTTGSINLAQDLVSKQAITPQAVNDEDLLQSAFTFRNSQ